MHKNNARLNQTYTWNDWVAYFMALNNQKNQAHPQVKEVEALPSENKTTEPNTKEILIAPPITIDLDELDNQSKSENRPLITYRGTYQLPDPVTQRLDTMNDLLVNISTQLQALEKRLNQIEKNFQQLLSNKILFLNKILRP